MNPQCVRGSRTGVFVGCMASESHDAWSATDADRVTGYEIPGCARSMFANRLTYFFDFKGLSCNYIYRVGQKVNPKCSTNNFDKYCPILKVLSPLQSPENLQCSSH